METVKRLLDETESEVYDLELNLLGKVKTRVKDGEGCCSLIFSEKPKRKLPEKVFLRPCADAAGFISYLCTLTGELTEARHPVSRAVYYTIEAFNEEVEILKDELRVYTSFAAEVRVDGKGQGIAVEVKDISVGGVMFITKEKLDVNRTFSLTFASGRKEITADVEIKTQRPVGLPGMYGYGCRFGRLSRNQEAEIRSFVFQEDIRRHR